MRILKSSGMVWTVDLFSMNCLFCLLLKSLAADNMDTVRSILLRIIGWLNTDQSTKFFAGSYIRVSNIYGWLLQRPEGQAATGIGNQGSTSIPEND